MTHPAPRSIPLPLALLVLAAGASAQTSSQQDARIVPEPNVLAQGDRFGESCDLDGATLVVGAPWHDPFGTSDAYGRAFVFVRTASGWVQEAELVSSSYDAGDRFGESIAVQGDVAVVGAPYEDESGAAAAGAVYVFVRTAGLWSEVARLTAADYGVFDHFGASVALDGDTLAIGAEFDDAGGGSFSGSAYVFVESSGTWVQQAKLVPPGLSANDLCGTAIALDGERLVVGAPQHDAGGLANAGSAWVFERAAGVWSLTAQLAPTDAAVGATFGSALAADSGRILVGAPHQSGATTNAGAAYVFGGAAATWTQEAKLVDIGFVFADQFGYALDLESERAVVGLPWSNAAGIATGGVQVFERSGGVWTGLFELVGSDCEAGDYLGVSVALSGDLVAAGAEWGETPPLDLQTGEAYVFEIVPPPFVASYCTSKPNSLGCLPGIGWSGAASASNPNPFLVTCDEVLGYVYGLAFYGPSMNAAPFLGGTLCVGAPITRTPLQHSGGNFPPGADCSGSFAHDMNATIQSGSDPALVAGAHAFAQYWSRDPADAHTVSLSDALEFVIAP
jgi:hypothetical protein